MEISVKRLATLPSAPEFNPHCTKEPFTFSQERTILTPLIADMGKHFSAAPLKRKDQS